MTRYKPRRPNVLWLMCDELRPDGVGCYGNKWGVVETPNLDSLAELGTRFGRFFVNSPICDAVVCVEPHYRMVRTRDHKYIWNRDDIAEVYDLNSDPGERKNLRGSGAEHDLLDLLIAHTGGLPESA